MATNLELVLHIETKAKRFLTIRKDSNEEFLKIDEFISKYPEISENDLDNCQICYRGQVKQHSQVLKDYQDFCKSLKILDESIPFILKAENYQKAQFYLNKTIRYSQCFRYYLIKSALILNDNKSLGWNDGYIFHFLERTMNFDSAILWCSIVFDQLLQAVYWYFSLYKNAVDRNGNPYQDDWNEKEILKACNYEFVVGELEKISEIALRKALTNCSGKIEEIRKWANYIKHKGGIDYIGLSQRNPIEITHFTNEEKIEMRDCESIIQLDLDVTITQLKDAYTILIDTIDTVKKLLELEMQRFCNAF